MNGQITSTEPVFIEGTRVLLRPLLDKDFTMAYLGWLNDPKINEFSQRRSYPQGPKSLRDYNDYFVANPHKGFVLAIIDRATNLHIGNISLVEIQPVHRSAEIAILIGDHQFWNKGYASECIALLSDHAFQTLNIHKLMAGTYNPSFAACVEKLGWKKEGEFRERIWAQGTYHSLLWYSLLEGEDREKA